MNSKEDVIELLKELGYSGSKTELRQEYENLYLVVKPQKSKFSEKVYLNFGVIYKGLMKGKTPKLNECQFEFRYRQLLMALKKKQFDFGIDDSFHLPQYEYQFKQNINNILNKFILELDDLERMKSEFPKNIPTLESEEDGVDYIEVIHYFNAEQELKKLFGKNKTTT